MSIDVTGKKNLFKAFTLAEVLITLGIIGVVAAMTIPTLMSNTNSQKFSSQFKKSVSTLSQAGLMALSQGNVDYSLVSGTCNDAFKDSLYKDDTTMCAIFNGTLSGAHIKAARAGTNTYKINGSAYGLPTTGNSYMFYVMADGSMVGFNQAMASGDCALEDNIGSLMTNKPSCIGFIDVNGDSPPNKVVTCKNKTDTALRSFSSDGLESNSCAVPKDSAHMTDIYPIVFHDSIVEPASNAAYAVMQGRTTSSGN